MKKIINSNCKKCQDFETGRCEGDLRDCLCRFCPRNLGVCIKVRWCRETESPMDRLDS
ncbi:MAG: hypothetical protein RSA01_10495 [Clostridium sp.]|uniref:hypothetical protein n=1 Tax=Clostridium sp. TaxID=1506 RepID=UPI002FC82F41